MPKQNELEESLLGNEPSDELEKRLKIKNLLLETQKFLIENIRNPKVIIEDEIAIKNLYELCYEKTATADEYMSILNKSPSQDDRQKLASELTKEIEKTVEALMNQYPRSPSIVNIINVLVNVRAQLITLREIPLSELENALWTARLDVYQTIGLIVIFKNRYNREDLTNIFSENCLEALIGFMCCCWCLCPCTWEDRKWHIHYGVDTLYEMVQSLRNKLQDFLTTLPLPQSEQPCEVDNVAQSIKDLKILLANQYAKCETEQSHTTDKGDIINDRETAGCLLSCFPSECFPVSTNHFNDFLSLTSELIENLKKLEASFEPCSQHNSGGAGSLSKIAIMTQPRNQPKEEPSAVSKHDASNGKPEAVAPHQPS